MKVILANDHGALNIREEVLAALKKNNFEVTDLGLTAGSGDYPDLAQAACQEFNKGGYAFGVLMCGTGIGISIAANKIAGIRCALIHDNFTAQMAKEHNNANFIALGGRISYGDTLTSIIQNFINAHFAAGRHQLRLDKITKLEKII